MDAGDVLVGGRVRQHFCQYGGDWVRQVEASGVVAGQAGRKADVRGGEMHRKGREADVR